MKDSIARLKAWLKLEGTTAIDDDIETLIEAVESAFHAIKNMSHHYRNMEMDDWYEKYATDKMTGEDKIS